MEDSSVIRGPLLLVSGPAATYLSPGRHENLVGRVGSAIRTARKMRGLSLGRLAQDTGLPPSTLSDIENGRSDLRVSAFILIETALGLSPGWLMRTVR